MIRRILAGVLVLVFLLMLVLAWLVSTTTAARWLAERAEGFEPNLQVTVTGGSLLTGLSVESLTWEMPGVSVSAKALDLEWDAGCLLDMTVCVDRIATQGLRLAVDTSELAPAEPPAAPEAASEPFSLPVAVRLDTLRAVDTSIRVDGNRVQLSSFETSLNAADDALHVHPTRLDGLTVNLQAPEPGKTEPEPTAAESSAPLEIELPDVELPLAIDLERLTLTDATLTRGALKQRLARLVLAVQASDGELQLKTLELKHPRGDVELHGQVALAGDWPLQLAAQITAPDLLPAGKERVALQATGSLADLKLDVTTMGPVAANARLSAQVLTPDIPFQAQMRAKALGWPLDSQKIVSAKDVDLQANGDLQQWSAQLSAALSGANIPQGEWQLRASGTQQSAQIKSLSGKTLEGRIDIAGDAAWAPQPQWDMTIGLEGINPGAFREGLKGLINGKVRVSGAVAAAGWRLNAVIPGISGRFRDRPLDVEGSVAHSPEGLWSVDGVRLASGDNRLRANGRIGEQWQLNADLALPAMGALWPGLTGRAEGEVELSGALAEPNVALQLSGQGVGYQEIALQSLQIDADVAHLATQQSTAEIKVAGLRQGDTLIGDIDLSATGSRSEHRLEASVEGGPAGGSLVLSGGLNSQTLDWRGALEKAGLSLPDGRWRLAQPASLQWAGAAAELTVGSHCWRHNAAAVCLARDSRFAASGANALVTVKDYDLADLQPWLPEGLSVAAGVSARAEVAWDGGTRPTVTASVESQNGRMTMTSPETEEQLELAYESIELGLDLQAERANVDLALTSERLGTANVSLRIDPYAEDRPVSGAVSVVDVPVTPAEPFVPAVQNLAGTISVDGDVSGSLASPAFNGEVRLADGRVGLQALPMTVEDIQVTVAIAGRRLNVQGGFRLGQGTGRIGGQLQWRGAPTATVALAGDKLEVKVPPYAEVAVSPSLSFNLTPNELRVNGRVGVPRARITIEQLPPSAVSVSKDVEIVGDSAEAAGDTAQQDQAKGEAFALSSNIYVVLGDDVRFSGFGAEGRLDGALQLREVGTAGAEANGEINVIDGTFKRFGQNLTIREGQFIFAGPLSQPRLNIEAVREVGDVVAGLRVTGSAKQPEAELFSEPTMPESDVLTYLVTGHAPGSGGASEGQLLSQAALSMGVFGGSAIGSSLAEDMGVKNFRVEGGGDDGDVAVAGDLSPNLMVRYGVGVFEPGNTLTLRYSLTQNLYLEAASGLNNALDIFYSFDF